MNERPWRHDPPDTDLADAGRPVVSTERSGWDVAGDGSRGGLASLADADLEPDLAAFLERSTEVLAAPPDEFTAHRHLAAMRNEARRGAGGSLGLRGAGGSLGLRVASVAAVVALTVMTLAGFGALPAPAQQVIADVADRFGLTIPAPTETEPWGFDLPTQRLPVPENVPAQPGAPDRDDLPGSGTDESGDGQGGDGQGGDGQGGDGQGGDGQGGDDLRRTNGLPSDQLEVIPPGTGGSDRAPREPAVDTSDPPGDRPESPPDPPADEPDPPPDRAERKPEPPSDPPDGKPEPPSDPPAGTPESPPDPPVSPPGPTGEEPGPGGPDDRP